MAVLTRTVTPGMIKHSRQGQERPEVVKWLNFYFCLCELSQSSEVTVETQAKTETRFASDFFFFFQNEFKHVQFGLLVSLSNKCINGFIISGS